jgi:hypothetical protein
MEIKKLYERAIEEMLRLKYMVKINEYLDNKTKSNYRDFEEEFETDGYPVPAPEMESSIDQLKNWIKTRNNDIFFQSNKIISSWDTTDEIAGDIIPHKKMIFLLYFTLLEGFGNNLLEITNEYLFEENNRKGKSWHSQVHRYNKDNQNINNFKKIFSIQSLVCPEEFIDLFLKMKEMRNRIAHENDYNSSSFHSDIESIMILTSYLYFSVTEDNDKITVFPWKDNAEWMEI